MVKTVHHRLKFINVLQSLIWDQNMKTETVKHIYLNNENNARFMQMCYTYCQNAYE